MITYIGQGKVEETILKQTAANTALPARVSPQLEVLTQAREVPSLKRAFIAQVRARQWVLQGSNEFSLKRKRLT